MWLKTHQISQPESQTRKDKLTIYNLASAWWKILIPVCTADFPGFQHISRLYSFIQGITGHQEMRQEVQRCLWTQGGIKFCGSSFPCFSEFFKCPTPVWELTFLYIRSSCLSLFCSKNINCFCSDTSQCQLMLAFSKSSHCPTCPHVASVAHSVVQESYEGAFCSALDSQFSCLFWYMVL